MAIEKRSYIVMCKRGRIAVTVYQYYIDKYGEREAIATVAWNKLMSMPETRDMLKTEMGCRYEGQRHHVYDEFREAISFYWMGFNG